MKFSEQRSDMISLSLLQDKSCSMILNALSLVIVSFGKLTNRELQ